MRVILRVGEDFGPLIAPRVQGYGLTETNAYVCSVAGPDYVKRVSLPGLGWVKLMLCIAR